MISISDPEWRVCCLVSAWRSGVRLCQNRRERGEAGTERDSRGKTVRPPAWADFR